jgi:hypothetical protein
MKRMVKLYDLVIVPTPLKNGFLSSNSELLDSNGIMTFHGISVDSVIDYIHEFQPKREHISLSEGAYIKYDKDYGPTVIIPKLLSEKDWPFEYVCTTKMVCEKK